MALLCITLLIAAPAYAANSPWFGTWSLRLSGASEKPETLIYSDGAMRMISVEDKSELVTHFDGKPAQDIGAGAAHHFALAITATSPSSYSWTGYRDEKLWIRGQNTLAADGRSFTEVSWAISKPDKKLTFIYDRR